MKNQLIIFSIIFAVILNFCIILPTKADEQSNDLTLQKADLEQQLQSIEAQISSLEQELSSTKKTKTTLLNKIKQLKTEQTYLRLQIKATTLKINQLNTKLQTTQNAIVQKTNRASRLQNQLLVVVKALQQEDQNFFITLARYDKLSDAFTEIQNYNKISFSLQRILNETRQIKKDLENQKQIYDAERTDAEQLLSLKSIQQKALLGSIGEQNDLLAETKGQENLYQTLLADTKKRAAEIRSRIYELFGGVKQINFGEAVTMAQWVGKQTGIRPAFLLAILTQESNLGKNVGTCNRAGDPPEKGWRVIMKPDRDQEPFLQITKDLGLDPDVTQVSCPMKDSKGKQFGWGGAMGPAQFIPSTWMGYRERVTAITGKTANPWDIRDAFVAAAIKLTADGGIGTENAEWKAAMRYFSGSTNSRYRFYGDNVIATAARYEKDIAELKN